VNPAPRWRRPSGYRRLFWCASLLVPRRLRADWLAEWMAELWYAGKAWEEARPSALVEGQLVMARFCWGAFVDAYWLRRNELYVVERSLLSPGSPLQCFARLLLLTAASLIVAMQLPNARNAILPSPYQDAGRVVLIAREGFAKASTPTVRLDDYRRWRSSTRKFFSDIAFYEPVLKRVHIAPHRVAQLQLARSTSNLFALRGAAGVLHPLRFSIGAGSPQSGPALVLSRSAWRAHFDADPKVFGRVIQVGQQKATVIGVVPDVFWPLPDHVDAWLLDDDDSMGALPGYTQGFVIANWRASALPGGSRGQWHMSGGTGDFDCTSLAFRIREPFRMFLFALGLSLLALPAITSLSLGEYASSKHGQRRGSQPGRWVFLLAKLVLAVPMIYFYSLDLAHLTTSIDRAHSDYIQLIVSFAGCLLALRWVLCDQRARCPACLRVLKNPARVGEPSRNFLAWNGTELICDGGHGLLHVPELPTSWFSTQRWYPLDPSWSSLFSTVVASAR
jgi:hypothetical protein